MALQFDNLNTQLKITDLNPKNNQLVKEEIYVDPRGAQEMARIKVEKKIEEADRMNAQKLDVLKLLKNENLKKWGYIILVTGVLGYVVYNIQKD
jgi:hypothetical protein